MKKMFCRGLRLLVFAGHVLFLNAQQTLKVGDALPKQFWETPLEMVNAPEKTTTLAGEKDKLLLLDFWATWCSSCLKNFPKMHQLEQQFGDRLKIFPVTTQDRTTVEKYFASPNGKKYSATPSAVAADAMKGYFPHRAIPYIIWIKNGRVLNTTDGDQVTASAIEELLAGKTSSLQTVLQIDLSLPFMIGKQFHIERQSKLYGYTFLSKGRIRSAISGSVFRRQNDVVNGRLFSNIVLEQMYQAIAREIFNKKGENLYHKSIVNLSNCPADLRFDPREDEQTLDHKLYTFDYITNPDRAELLYEDMLLFLNRSLDYVATVETRTVPCLVLRRTNESPLPAMDEAESTTMNQLTQWLNADERITTLPVVDESGITGRIALDKKKIPNMTTLKQKLGSQHIELVEAERNMMKLIIRDKDFTRPLHTSLQKQPHEK